MAETRQICHNRDEPGSRGHITRMASRGPGYNKVPQGLFFFYSVPLMAIPLSPCVSVSFYVLFSPPPLHPPQFAVNFFSPKSQTRSTNSPSHFSSISHLLSLRLSWGTVYIRAQQSPAPLVATATSLITASTVFFLSASFFFFLPPVLYFSFSRLPFPPSPHPLEKHL